MICGGYATIGMGFQGFLRSRENKTQKGWVNGVLSTDTGIVKKADFLLHGVTPGGARKGRGKVNTTALISIPL